jgi:hypothetical protein
MATEYVHHPEPSCVIEFRDDGITSDDYIARARGFSSTAEFREYRCASERRREEMRADRDSRDDGADDNRDLVRVVELLKATK